MCSVSAQEEIGPVTSGKASHTERTGNFFSFKDFLKSSAQKVLKSSNNHVTVDRKQVFFLSRKTVRIKYSL